MNALRFDMRVRLLGIALVGACGDDEATDTGNDTQTQTNSETNATGDTSSEGGSSSGSATLTTTATATNTTETGSTESGSTTDGTVTLTTTATESSGPDTGSSGSSDESSSSSSGGPMCSAQDESCADGMPCCAGLDCCQGQPIPPGSEYCSANLCPISDRNKKENFAAVDPHNVLAKVVALPITSWNYTFEDPSVRHIGPMAQDFKAAFDVGSTDKAIFQVDADGVVLASVQALHSEIEALQKENDDLRERLDALEAALAKRAGG